tara:strand:- start:260 stop:1042 length:783 start_codon:yes stop_codon:yes gene_type:complete
MPKLTKKQLIDQLLAMGIKEINGKALSKCSNAILLNKLNPAPVEAKAETKPSKSVAKAKPKAKASNKKQAPKKSPAIKEMTDAEKIAFAMKLAEEAKNQGVANKDKITKPRKVTKSKWADQVAKLIASESHKSKDGTYRFSLKEVIDLTGWNAQSPKNPKKCASWILYAGDWKPTYRGLGSSFVLAGYEAQVTGAPSNKQSRESYVVKDDAKWEVIIKPLSHKQQLDYVVPRVKGTIKNWVYTQEQLSELRMNINSETAA